VNFDFLPGGTSKWSFDFLKTYDFAGGNQIATAEPSLMYLPEFKLFSTRTSDLKFDFEIYSPTGMPGFICLYARFNDAERAQDYGITQPMIEFVKMQCDTTKRKSDILTDTFNSKEGLGKHQMFHLTQRNVHAASNYNSTAYNKRQTVLLCAEDIGLMGLDREEYQTLKRVKFRVSGSCNLTGTVNVLFVYNNRGLNVDGAQLSVVRM